MFVLLKDTDVIGVFGSFKKACEHAKTLDNNFPSYWTLTRNKENRMDVNGFSIQKANKY